MKKYLILGLFAVTHLILISSSTYGGASLKPYRFDTFDTYNNTGENPIVINHTNWNRFYIRLKEYANNYPIYEVLIDNSDSPTGKNTLVLEYGTGLAKFKFFNANQKTVVIFTAFMDQRTFYDNCSPFNSKHYTTEGSFYDAIAYWNECMNKYDGIPMD